MEYNRNKRKQLSIDFVDNSLLGSISGVQILSSVPVILSTDVCLKPRLLDQVRFALSLGLVADHLKITLVSHHFNKKYFRLRILALAFS